MLPTVLTAMGVIAAVLLGVWGIVARYDSRVRDRMDGQLGQLRDRLDTQGKGTSEQLGQLRDRIDAQGKETSEQLGQLRDRIDAQGKETSEQLGQLRERMAKLEGTPGRAPGGDHRKASRIGRTHGWPALPSSHLICRHSAKTSAAWRSALPTRG